MALQRDGRFDALRRLGLVAVVLATGAALSLCGRVAGASEESVDQLIRAALALDANPERGGERFNQHCAGCHGAGGIGDAARAIPVLAGQRYGYLVRQLASLSGDQRDSAQMHLALAAPEWHNPRTCADVAAYLNTAPVPERTQKGDGRRLGLGKATFRVQCATCHHEDAAGDNERFVPSLRHQHYSYLVNQIKLLSEFHRHNVDENIARLLRSLNADETSGVADYLSRLRGAAPERKTMHRDGTVAK